MDIYVTKNDKTKEQFDIQKIKQTYEKIALELKEKCPFENIKEDLKKYLVDKIKTKDIMKLLIKTTINLISIENIDRQTIAWRLLTIDLYKKASRNTNKPITKLYTAESYLELMQEYIKGWLYYQDFFKYYSTKDILDAWKYIKKERDMDYWYTTLTMFNKRYLLNPNGIIKELPQQMYMWVALFLAVPEKKEDRLSKALEFYDILSLQKLSPGTPFLMNARRKFHQLSNCFVMSVDDDLRSIYHSIENVAQLSKYWWWVGVYRWHIRSKWASIRGMKWVSWWVIPRLKVLNDTATAVNQLWARAWAVSVTTDIRNKDIHDYLNMQTETWDIRRKCFDIFPAISLPDLFMKRVEEQGKRTLFDPKEIYDITWKKLEDHFNQDFDDFYKSCEKDDRLKLKETIDAKNLFKTALKSVVETWLPYIFFRDTVNKLNANKHAWNVYSSQLCTEITQNMKPSKFTEEIEKDWNISIKYKAWDSVVCNLASINVAKVNTIEEIKKIIPISMRILDNVTTMSFYPFKESELTAKKYRSVWLWFLGLAEHLATNWFAYESQEARDYVDELFENYAYYTLQWWINLAKERWYYELFPWSERSKGIVMWKDKTRFKQHTKTKLNREQLLSELQTHGTRFAYHMSPAPNASTANVIWTTAWILPIYKKYYVYTDAIAPIINVAPKLSKENMRLYKEYVNMKMTEVIDMVATIQKRIDQSISFEWIINPANTSPKDLYDYYFRARKSRIKTIYYVRSMSLEVKECISCSW